MLDQPTQAYDPSDTAKSAGQVAGADRATVLAIFTVMRDVVASLTPRFQVIVSDHANLRNGFRAPSATSGEVAPSSSPPTGSPNVLRSRSHRLSASPARVDRSAQKEHVAGAEAAQEPARPVGRQLSGSAGQCGVSGDHGLGVEVLGRGVAAEVKARLAEI